MQTFNDILLADAQRNAGSARTSAVDAANAATTANSESEEATASSRISMTLARGARKEADSLEHDIASAKTEAADAVSRLAEAEEQLADATQREASAEEEINRIKTPRSLIHADELTAKLKPFRGVQYTLESFQDQESLNFTRTIGNVLANAGWVRKQPVGLMLGAPTWNLDFGKGDFEHVTICINTGVSIEVSSTESVEALNSPQPEEFRPKSVRAARDLRALLVADTIPPGENNAVKGIIDPKQASTEGLPMVICVGKKP